MRILSRLAAVLFALITIPLFIAAACNLAFLQSALDPGTYAEAFRDTEITADLLPSALSSLFEQANEVVTFDGIAVEVSEVQRTLSQQDWRSVVNTLVPPEWLNTQINELGQLIPEALQGSEQALERQIDLSTLRANFEGRPARDAAALIIQAAPSCTITQRDAIRSLISTGTGRLPICEPGALQRQDSIDLMTEWIRGIGKQLPTDAERVTYGQLLQISPEEVRIFPLLVEINQAVLYLLYICPVGLIGLIIFLAVRSWKGFGGWIGTITLLTGVLLLFVLLLWQTIVIGSLTELLLTQTDATRYFASVISGFLRSIFMQSSGTLLAQTVGFLLIGVGLLLTWAFLQNRRSTSGTVPTGKSAAKSQA